MPTRIPDRDSLPINRLWYKDAVIYELHVRAFHDSDADGGGDFRGLTEKLPYLQDLGVTAMAVTCFSLTTKSRFIGAPFDASKTETKPFMPYFP